MEGLMQDWPLRLHRLLDHAAIQHGGREVVSRAIEGPIHRTTYAQLRERSLRVAKRLVADGVRHGDRVGTLALNTWRHLEAWYGIAGAGAVIHTVNPRLFVEQIGFIIDHAADRVMMVDLPFVPLLESLADKLPALERTIVLTDAAHMPATSLRGAIAFEDWIADVDADFAWHAVDEGAAVGLCYTSGTTGPPKGVLYSHRSNVLHTWMTCAGGSLCPLASDSLLMIVPMFHANAWGLTFAGPMVGAKLVMPGAKLDGDTLFDLMAAEGVTITVGVPTVLMALLATMRGRGRKPPALRRVVVGGSACPRAVIAAFEGEFGIEIFHAWGMTETSPLGTVGTIKPADGHLSGDALYDLKSRQGSAPFGVEMAITDDEGRHLPWDGQTFGRLKVKGAAVARAYYRQGEPILDAEGFFDTQDVATIAPNGSMHITDRAKDVIKSGGEWISSIEIENAALGHPDVAEAAVIGVAHRKWIERPLLVVVPAIDGHPDKDAILTYLSARMARWWVPDDVQVVTAIPHTAAGKIDKVALRALFSDYRLPA